MSELPTRPSACDVEAAIYRIQHPTYAPNITAEVIVRELLHLRACIERCKSVQIANEETAQACERALAGEYDDRVIRMFRQRLNAHRGFATELEKALEGF